MWNMSIDRLGVRAPCHVSSDLGCGVILSIYQRLSRNFLGSTFSRIGKAESSLNVARVVAGVYHFPEFRCA